MSNDAAEPVFTSVKAGCIHPMDMAPEARINRVERVHCAHCGRTTKHTIRGAFDADTEDEELRGIHWHVENDLLSCNGCEAGTYRISAQCDEIPERFVVLHPASGERSRKALTPKDFESFPCSHPVLSIYEQTIVAFNNSLSILAAAGVRLIIEGICTDRGIADGEVASRSGSGRRRSNLEGRINGMAENGLIGKEQAEILHEIRFLGNAAAHELHRPSCKVLIAAIGIVEHIIGQVYEQPLHAEVLAAKHRNDKAS